MAPSGIRSSSLWGPNLQVADAVASKKAMDPLRNNLYVVDTAFLLALSQLNCARCLTFVRWLS